MVSAKQESVKWKITHADEGGVAKKAATMKARKCNCGARHAHHAGVLMVQLGYLRALAGEHAG